MTRIRNGSVFLDGKKIESESGAQAKADQAEQNAKEAAAVVSTTEPTNGASMWYKEV